MNDPSFSVSIPNASFRSVTLRRIVWAAGLVVSVVSIFLEPQKSLGHLATLDAISKWCVVAFFAIQTFFNPAAREIPDSFVVDGYGLSTSYGGKRRALVPLTDFSGADVSPGGPIFGPPWQNYTVTLNRKPSARRGTDVPIVREWRSPSGSIRIPGAMTKEAAQKAAREINALLGKETNFIRSAVRR